MTDYFDTLAERLREHGVAPEEVRDTLEDLAVFADESGADPHAEFGPAEEFARQLAAATTTASGAGPETRVMNPPAAPRRRFFLGWPGAALALVAAFCAVCGLISSVPLVRELLNLPPGFAEAAGLALGAVAVAGTALLIQWGVSALVTRVRAG